MGIGIVWGELVSFSVRIGNYVMGRLEHNATNDEDQERLAEDILLANAIKTEDWKTVYRIVEKRKNYSTLNKKDKVC